MGNKSLKFFHFLFTLLLLARPVQAELVTVAYQATIDSVFGDTETSIIGEKITVDLTYESSAGRTGTGLRIDLSDDFISELRVDFAGQLFAWQSNQGWSASALISDDQILVQDPRNIVADIFALNLSYTNPTRTEPISRFPEVFINLTFVDVEPLGAPDAITEEFNFPVRRPDIAKFSLGEIMPVTTIGIFFRWIYDENGEIFTVASASRSPISEIPPTVPIPAAGVLFASIIFVAPLISRTIRGNP